MDSTGEQKFCPRCAGPLSPRAEGGRSRLACTAPGCGYVFYGNPVPVVAAIVEHEGKVLLVRNKGWPEKMFGLMTGFLEAGEAPEVAVLRELEEELGLKGEVVSLVGLYAFEQMNQLIVAYHVKAEG
ncbi:MAG: NUDIX domain-containing protein, partial [Myxococcaceae bacterium]